MSKTREEQEEQKGNWEVRMRVSSLLQKSSAEEREGEKIAKKPHLIAQQGWCQSGLSPQSFLKSFKAPEIRIRSKKKKLGEKEGKTNRPIKGSKRSVWQ